ncbi:MAG TPA: flavin reductase family protein [Dehalococcoidia bacterium]|nr:flavin reductase family protein [Dehalococcoidia bacterium]
MSKIISEGVGAFAQHFPAVATIVTAQAKGKENAMAVAWHAPISLKPPLYGVSISPKRFTYQLIADSKEFGINFLPFEAAELVASVGGSKGSEVDKFQRFNIAKNKPVMTAVPILEAAYAAYECQLVDDRSYGDHRWLVGEIVAVHWLEEVFTPDEVIDLDKVSSILYLGNELYVTTSRDTIRSLDRKVYGKR